MPQDRQRELNRRALRRLPAQPVSSWDAYLAHNCRLPGPNVNFALVEAAADEADEARIRHWRAADRGSEDDAGEFLAMCGIAGLGALAGAAFGDRRRVAPRTRQELREYANDRRWRVREAVMLALQRIGDVHVRPLFEIAEDWIDGTALERRAVVVAVCQPRFVAARSTASRDRIPALVDRATASYVAEADRADLGAVELREALASAWSVVLSGNEAACKPFERWVAVARNDRDVREIVASNCATQRLQRSRPDAVAAWNAQIHAGQRTFESPE